MKAFLVASCVAIASAQLIDSNFESRVQLAVEDVKNLFAPSRQITSALSVPHYYEDKYYLAEFVGTMGSSSTLVGLDRLGLTLPQLAKLKTEQYDKGNPVQFLYKSRSVPSFVKKEAVADGKVVETIYTIYGAFTRSTVNVIIRYHWTVTTTSNITAVNPLNPAVSTTLKAATSTFTMYRSSNDQAPTFPDGDATLDAAPVFSLIGRITGSDALSASGASALCHGQAASGCTTLAAVTTRRLSISMNQSVTPTGNPTIDSVRADAAKLAAFAGSVAYHVRELARITSQKLTDTPTFTPAILLMDSAPCGKDASSLNAATQPSADAQGMCKDSVVLGAADATTLLKRYDAVVQTYEAASATDSAAFVNILANNAPAQSMQYGSRTGGAILVDAMLGFVVGSTVLERAVQGMEASLNNVRDMLYKQVDDAVGQRVTAEDVMTYATGVGAAAFLDGHKPAGFSYAVRRVEAAATAVVADAASSTAVATPAVAAANPPEGFLSLEWRDSKAVWRPVKTASQSIVKAAWKVGISDGVDAVINSTATVHGFVVPSFGGSTIPGFALNLNARPFGGLILMVGGVSGTTITPDAAIIIRDRDAVQIPVILNAIPSPKDFAKAISSISPRMKAFAEAFRALQLQRSVLAVAAIPLKPQMETILHLPAGALSKHLALTDSLLRLFLDYGISPSLLAYDPTVDAAAVGAGANASESENAAAAIAAVKKNVANVLAAIDSINQRALDEQKKAQQFNGGNGGISAPSLGSIMGGLLGSGSAGTGFGGRLETTFSKPGIDSSINYASANAGNVDSSTTESDGATNTNMPQNSMNPDEMTVPQAFIPPAGAIAAATVTTLPKALDARFLSGDVANALRPTILELSGQWTRTRALSFLEKPKKESVSSDVQTTEKRAALQLLDILTEAGGAPMESASLHFLMAATHNFARSVMSSVVDGNRNVLRDVTRSLMMVTEVLTGMTGNALLSAQHPDTAALLLAE